MALIRSILAGLLVALVLSGCTSMQPVEDTGTAAGILNAINPGDHIHVETRNGGKYELVVDSIDIKAVKGGGREIPLDQIRTIKKKQISALKTTGAIVGGGLAYALIGVLLVLSAF